MEKSASAFRTISEVADFLETPAHVLRFWESRFPQIKPVKRAGGRRYYRPGDVALLAGIKRLLHDEGMTIRGVQKILREQGVRHVSGMSETESDAAEALNAAFPPDVVDEKPEAQVVSLSDWAGTADIPVTATPPDPETPIAETPLQTTAADVAPTPPVEPVITDDEIVEEDAFRSALDWAKSLTPSEHRVSTPADTILHLTEKVAGETGKAVDQSNFDTHEYGAVDDDFGPDDAFDDEALSPDVAAESPAMHSFAADADQTQQPDPDQFEPDVVAMADSTTATPDAPEAPLEDGTTSVWLPTHLRHLTATELTPHTPALRALHARLAALHARMADAARSSRT